MMNYHTFAQQHDAIMEAMCDECDNDKCVHHGGEDEPCEKFQFAEDAWDDYGDQVYHDGRDER